jgi:hypothetical protein
MTSQQYANAILAREDQAAATRALIVAGDERQAELWRSRLGRPRPASDAFPHVVVERGRKGNLLGTLQAYQRVFVAPPTADDPPLVEQIVMLVGSGTRLSPFTQALGNIKAAFPVPDAEAPPDGLAIGEAAIRSSSPLVSTLHTGGFAGLVVRWGDEVLIPSSSLAVLSGQFADMDVVRFGWATRPTDLLATQKEWLLVARQSGLVMRDIPRQSLESLEGELHGARDHATDLYVNLGSFAASHRFLRAACQAFGPRIDDETTAANWDPYFWIALQCPDRAAWLAIRQREATDGRVGLRDLESGFPQFFDTVQALKGLLRRDLGRDVRVGVLDFGQPYWLDAGNHVALRNAFSSIFEPGQEGGALRAFLGLPDSLAEGESFILDSHIAAGARVRNSVVIGSHILSPDSDLDGAIVMGSRLGRLRVTRGGAAISCVADDLQVDGPHGMAFRLNCSGKVHGSEGVATLATGTQSFVMRYDESLGAINTDEFSEVVLGNPMSFSAASKLMSTVDPTWLDEYWRSLRVGSS